MAKSNRHDKKGSSGRPIKPLPSTTYPRGTQGTFVYAPDVAVYVQTDDYGIVDLSRFITTFTLQRNVNNASSFTCTFDNKHARFDRVVRRMDRIVVFMKRVHWVQVFAGYISVAPWQTVVPGDAMLQADCTLKRVAYTYWDPSDPAAIALFPVAQGSAANVSADGGSAGAMFRLLHAIAGWDPAKIHIQKLPEKWLDQAVQVIKLAKEDFDTDTDFQVVKNAIIRLLDADGWQGVQLKGILANTVGGVTPDSSKSKWTNALTGGPDGFTSIDQKWHKEVGQRSGRVESYPEGFGTTPEYYSGFIPLGKLTNTHVQSASGQSLYLRVDAAAALEALYNDYARTQKKPFSIRTGYLGYGPQQRLPGQANDQRTIIHDWVKANDGSSIVACASVKCPAGTSDHGWGTAIDFNGNQGGSPPESVMNRYGWIKDISGDGADNQHHWVFVGNYDQGYPAYTKPGERPDTSVGHGRPAGGNAGDDTNQFNWHQYNRDTGQDGGNTTVVDPAFKTEFFMPHFDVTTQALGKRAWINNVPLIESVVSFASASMRDFQSAPNGDFVAFFPDRLGIYGKFPTMQVRDIEVVDFKLIISDRNMVTHYASVGDFSQVQENIGIELDVIFNSGTLSVEQDEVMGLLLGLGKEVPTGLGQAIMEKFGLRPKRDDNYNLYNFGYNYMNALHRFQEAWANQWQALVSFTFLPEVFPGMRIELADKGIGVYVESVTHSGSRSGGFTTTVMVSSPMRRMPDGKWALLNMELNIKDFVDTDRVTDQPTDVSTMIREDSS